MSDDCDPGLLPLNKGSEKEIQGIKKNSSTYP